MHSRRGAITMPGDRRKSTIRQSSPEMLLAANPRTPHGANPKAANELVRISNSHVMNVNMVRNGFHFVNPQTVQSLGQPKSDIQPFLARRGPIKSHSDHEPNSIPVRNEFDRAARFNQLPQAVKIIFEFERVADRTSGTSNDGSRLGPRDFLDAWPSTCLAVLLTRWRRLAGVRASSVKRNNSRRCVGFYTRNASSAPRVFSSSRRISEGTLT